MIQVCSSFEEVDMYDIMAHEIANKQRRAWDAMYDPMELANDRAYHEAYRKREEFKKNLLRILKEDPKFAEEVRQVLDQVASKP